MKSWKQLSQAASANVLRGPDFGEMAARQDDNAKLIDALLDEIDERDERITKLESEIEKLEESQT